MAQLVEQYTFNVWVTGPSPVGVTALRFYINVLVQSERQFMENWRWKFGIWFFVGSLISLLLRKISIGVGG